MEVTDPDTRWGHRHRVNIPVNQDLLFSAQTDPFQPGQQLLENELILTHFGFEKIADHRRPRSGSRPEASSSVTKRIDQAHDRLDAGSSGSVWEGRIDPRPFVDETQTHLESCPVSGEAVSVRVRRGS